MQVKRVYITEHTIKKILRKHNLRKDEIERTIFEDYPIYLKTRNERYLCIGRVNRYITIIFNLNNKFADVITAYQSSKWQIKLHKRKT